MILRLLIYLILIITAISVTSEGVLNDRIQWECKYGFRDDLACETDGYIYQELHDLYDCFSFPGDEYRLFDFNVSYV